MPTVNENFGQWESYAWERRGDEWSDPWGNPDCQWAITIYPRIMRCLPVDSIVEIAPGFGRWTPFLLGLAPQYTGFDIAPSAIKFCQQTFGRLRNRPRFIVGDGSSLLGVADASTDFVFSFDSLVHVELDCLAAYAKEIQRVLRPGGHAFLHHSNFAELVGSDVANVGWRGVTVSAEAASHVFLEAGLSVVTQEKIPWVFEGGFVDCFSLVEKPLHGHAIDHGRRFYNEDFKAEYTFAGRIADRYGL